MTNKIAKFRERQKEIMLLMAVWALVYLWRLPFLGFYSDDYTLIFKAVNLDNFEQRSSYLMEIFANRPLCGLMGIFWTSLYGDNALLWHLHLSFLSLMNALIIYGITHKLNNLACFIDEKKEFYFAAIWLALPITLGFTIWPTMAFASPSLTFFLFAFYFIFKGPKLPFKNIVFSISFYALSIFTYEVFYLQFLPLLALVWIFKKKMILKSKNVLQLASLFFVLQMVAIIFNRLSHGGVKKSLNIQFVLGRIQAVIENPRYLYQAIIPIAIVLFFIGFSIKLIIDYKKKKKTLSERKLVFGVSLFASLLSVLIFLSAGYSIRPFGTGSRTTMVFSFWLLIMLMCITLPKKISSAKNNKILGFVFLSILLGINFCQSVGWIKSWEIQQKVLKSFPIAKFQNLESEATVVAIMPNYYKDVIILEEDGTFEHAIESKYPDLEHKNFQYLVHKHQGFQAATFVYSQNIIKRLRLRSGHWGGEWQRPYFYLWNYYTGSVHLINADLTLEVEQDFSKLDLSTFPVL